LKISISEKKMSNDISGTKKNNGKYKKISK
jgi:hypothetical protein